MKQSEVVDVISVDPSKATLGSLNADRAFEFARRHVPTPSIEDNGWKDFLNFTFASGKTSIKSLPASVTLLRLSLAALFLTMIFSGTGASATLTLSVACISLAFGFLTRFVCGACAVILTFMALGSGGTGLFAGTELMQAFACTVFAVTGAGKFSVDSYLRVACLNLKRRQQNKKLRKSSENGYITLKNIR